MRGFKPDDQRQSQGGNMGRDAVMAAIARQSGQAPQSERPKLDSGPMRGLRQVLSGSIFDRRKALEEQERKASSYADGGRVRPRGFVAGPGTGTSDSIKERLSDGEYVLPADTVQAVGVDALDALKDATHTPVAKPDKNRMGEPLFANAGLVDDERKRNSFGDAAAAANDHGVQQVMGQATQMTAAPEVRAAIGQQLDAPARVQAAVSQIPIGVSISPDAPSKASAQTPTGTGFMPGTRAVFNESGKAISDLVGQGRYGAATGETVRGALAYVPAVVDDVVGGAVRAVGPSLMDAGRQLFGMNDTTTSSMPVATPGRQPVVANADSKGQASGVRPINTTDRSGDANMPAMDVGARGFGPAVVPAAPTAPKVAPGIYRQGNSFGDSPEAAAWGASGRKSPNANDLMAADAIANRSAQQVSALAAQQPIAAGFQPVQAPQVLHSGNSWQARNDLRNAEVSASSIANNGGRWDQHGRGVVSPERANYAALLSADAKARGLEPELAGKAMSENARLQQGQMSNDTQRDVAALREAGETVRAGGRNLREDRRFWLDAQRYGLDATAKGFDIRAGQRKEGVLQRYDAAKTDDERAALIKQHPEVFGRDKESAPRMEVVRGSVDPETGKRDGDYALIFNPKNNSVQRVGVDGSPGGRPAADSQQVQSIVNDTSLSKEQRAAKLRQLGFE